MLARATHSGGLFSLPSQSPDLFFGAVQTGRRAVIMKPAERSAVVMKRDAPLSTVSGFAVSPAALPGVRPGRCAITDISQSSVDCLS